ncbi:DMT family transporter [Nocardioides antri]|uniref:Multidrug efflux SMR transporter n=1 Tax=Nocardioides antri TaxID=2607659 RepID=A0A5B1M7N5_9ACTN|nr:multidrug efflux SMR transporter [Nocardioides antri]KAA1427780.1 multidrug efflux SMR transporter [Nocardioides antri]
MYGAITLLLGAIAIEVFATASLPKADGFRAPGWSAAVIVGYAASIWMLSLVVRTMSVSIAYALWAGIGTAMVAVVGMALGESMTLAKAVSLALIVAGVIGLNLAGAH